MLKPYDQTFVLFSLDLLLKVIQNWFSQLKEDTHKHSSALHQIILKFYVKNNTIVKMQIKSNSPGVHYEATDMRLFQTDVILGTNIGLVSPTGHAPKGSLWATM